MVYLMEEEKISTQEADAQSTPEWAVWDLETNNLLGEFHTEEEALAYVDDLVQVNWPALRDELKVAKWPKEKPEYLDEWVDVEAWLDIGGEA
jgi:hypothetical protein